MADVRPHCDACKMPVTDQFYKSKEHGTHCDVCYRLVILKLIHPNGVRRG